MLEGNHNVKNELLIDQFVLTHYEKTEIWFAQNEKNMFVLDDIINERNAQHLLVLNDFIFEIYVNNKCEVNALIDEKVV